MDSLYHVGVKSKVVKRRSSKKKCGPKPGGKRPSKDWSVYIVSCKDGSLYTGITKNVEARIKVHNSGKGAAYTRGRGPVILRYREDGFTQSAALVREAAIKSLNRPQKKELIRHSS